MTSGISTLFRNRSWVIRGSVVGVLLVSSSAHAYRTAGDLADFSGTERVGWSGGITSFVLVDDAPSLPMKRHSGMLSSWYAMPRSIANKLDS